jgi:glycosyltransferase involved in cell wall biosynthesis
MMLIFKKDVKLVVHFHGDIQILKFVYLFYKPFERLLFQRANRIITTSPILQNEEPLLRRFINKCVTIENVISTYDLDIKEEDKIKIENLKAKYNNKKIILSFGRHVPYKGLRYLIDATQYIKEDYVIIIGGDGPLTEELKQMAISCNKIHFVGRIPNLELKYYLHAADIFAFPSITKAEAFGITLLESMYCYTTPVTFTIAESGVNYVSLKNQTGLEVENANAYKFGQAINALLLDEELRQNLAENAHKRVIENFTIDFIKPKLIALYESL